MLSRHTAIIGAAIIAGAHLAAPAAPTAADRATIARLRQAVIDVLRDAPRARLRGLYLSAGEPPHEAVRALCGEINAPNGMGGFTGFTRFVSTTAGLVVFEADEPFAAFDAIWPVWCARPV